MESLKSLLKGLKRFGSTKVSLKQCVCLSEDFLEILAASVVKEP